MDLPSIQFFNRNYVTDNSKIYLRNKSQYITATNINKSDNVSFSGAAKTLSSIQDKAFLEILSNDMKLSEELSQRLKSTIWNFLMKHKIDSLSELEGDKFIEEQTELQSSILNKLNLREDDWSEYLAFEVVRRCDNGDKYVPGGLRVFKKEQNMEQMLMKKGLVAFMKESYNADKDNEFYDFVKQSLRQSPMENYEFRETIDDFLAKNNMKSIEDLAGDDYLNEISELIEILKNKFSLGDYEMNSVLTELINRANSSKSYTPISKCVFARDENPLNFILDEGNYDFELANGQRFGHNLLDVMSDEANKKNYESIFDIFLPENSPLTSDTYKYIASSGLSKDKANNLLIDLSKVSKDPDSFAETLPKNPLEDNFYALIQSGMFADKLVEHFNLDASLTDEIGNFAARLFPKHVSGGENVSISQLAYELAEKFGLPSGAEKTITKIWSDIECGGKKSADIYTINKLMSE